MLLFALGQALVTRPSSQHLSKMGTLIIEFSGLQNNKGKVLAGLYDEDKKFPKENLAPRNPRSRQKIRPARSRR